MKKADLTRGWKATARSPSKSIDTPSLTARVVIDAQKFEAIRLRIDSHCRFSEKSGMFIWVLTPDESSFALFFFLLMTCWASGQIWSQLRLPVKMRRHFKFLQIFSDKIQQTLKHMWWSKILVLSVGTVGKFMKPWLISLLYLLHNYKIMSYVSLIHARLILQVTYIY